MLRHPFAFSGLLGLLALVGCGSEPEPKTEPEDSAAVQRDPAPAVTTPPPALRRLTKTQYNNAIRDLFAAELYVPENLEPDNEVEGLLSVGASTTSVSSYGVELYESAARTVVDQVLENEAAMADLYSCTPTGASDEACGAEILGDFARRAWRRPISDTERSRMGELVAGIGGSAGDFEVGLGYGLVAILQSPNFLYRREHGEGEGSQRNLTAFELASRLSFLLWNSIPDDALLAAAEDGSLLDDGVLESQTRRMLDDPKASDGLRNLFDEVFHLYNLPSVSKDPLVFTYASPELGVAAREETLMGIEALVLDENGDFLDLFVTQRTFVDRRLAALYNIAADNPDGFGEVYLPDGGGRRGLFGQASFLLLQSHATSTSATKRGKFIRTTVLCNEIPAPPADVDTSIPEADATSPTLRERLETHLSDPYCASCHQLTDPIGLAFENFDGLGQWRLTENGATIDPSGDLDGVPFADAWELGQVVAESPNVPRCFSRHVYRYATGRLEAEGEDPLIDWLAEGFQLDGNSFRELLVQTTLSPGFRQVGEIQ